MTGNLCQADDTASYYQFITTSDFPKALMNLIALVVYSFKFKPTETT